MEENKKLKDALEMWQERELNRAEAVSNADPHVFPQAFIHETLEKMERAEEKSKHKPKASILEKANISNRMLAMVAMAAVFVLLIIPLATNALSDLGNRGNTDSAGASITAENVGEASALENSQAVAANQNGVESAANAMTDSEAPVAPAEKVTVPSGYYSVSGDTITFVTPNFGIIYRSVPGESPSELINIKAQMDAHGGIDHFGVQGDTLYVGFNDGRGLEISGNPLVATESRYWHEEWFAGNEELPASLEDGVIYQDAQYLFEK